MDRRAGISRSSYRTLLFGAIALLALAAMSIGARATFASGPPPSITCDRASTTYGEPVSCTAEGGGVAGVVWPDEATAPPGPSTHAPRAVGDLTVDAVNEAGVVVASAPLAIAPDIELDCAEGDEKIIYELAATDLRSEGWDYVFVDSTTGSRILPGDVSHPNGGSEDGLHRIELGRAPSTGFCQIHSAAGDDLDGDYRVTLVSALEGTVSHPVRIIGPASRTRWSGTQPAELTGTVTIGTVSASERREVYLSGCA